MLAYRSAIAAAPAPAGTTPSGIAWCPDAPDRRRWIAMLITLNSIARRQARSDAKTTVSMMVTTGWWVEAPFLRLLGRPLGSQGNQPPAHTSNGA